MNRIERLEKILNKTSGNPYHDNEGKFTFSPSSFKNTSGKDAEVTDNPRDWYLTDLSRKNINKVSEISSTKELKDYLSSNGISSDIDNPAIKKYEDYENIKFDALQKQASGIVASVEFCKAVFGKESLSKLKEIKFYSSEAETTGSFDVMLKGEKPSKTNGTMELSTNITNRGILHEFIHVVQDSTKKKSQDSVLWSKEILDKTGVNSKAYAGANKNHLAAEQLADLISFGIADGKNLEDVSKVINYIRKNKTENSIQFNGGKGSGNFNPGQGRGVGKPSKHSINTDISKSGLTHKSGEATAGYTGTTSASIINDLLRQGLDTKDYQSVIDRLDSNMEEIKVDTLLKRGVSFNFLKANSEAFGITEDMGYKEVQKNIIGKSFKELGYSSATYGDESDYGSIHLKIKCPKGTKAIWTGNDKEKEVIISRGTTFKVNDYRRENENDPWSKIIVDLEVISQDNLNKKNNMITNGGPGSGNFNPGQGRGIGKPSKSSILSNKMKSLSWNETQDLLRDKETRQIIKEIGLKTYDDLWNMWAKVKVEDFTEKDIKEIDIDDAFDVVRKNIRLSALEGWFVNADSNYKPEIVTKILENKELRNAGLNIAYYNYKNRFESDISFSDFIKTPISLYRGEHGQTHVEQDWFDAYTPVKDIAEGFGEIVTEIKIKPIETLGAYFDNAESEYLVLTKTSMYNMNSMKDENLFITRINKLDKILNSINENLDYRYDVKAYKEYLQEWLKHKDEKEYLNGGVLSFAEFWEYDIDYEFEDYKKILKLIDEYNKKKELVINGGPGSGNFNPGQGRGVGKPANGHTSHGDTQYSAKNYLSKKEYENIVNYSSEDNFTEEELDAIASYAKSMGYGASCDLNQAIRENDFGEIIERENVVFPEDDSQIVTWKENKEFIEQKIKDKKKYDSLNQEIQLAASVLRKGGLSDEKETEKLRVYVSDMQKERDNLSKTLKYSEYENYIKNYEKGLYKDIKDDQKMWTIDEDKLSKISVAKLREKQKLESKRFDEVLEIPRLMWSMYYDDKPTTTDTLANKYQKDFKDLDKLDNIIKNKGFVLDKDITVTRRVANAKVIENQIKNKGEYTQNGITSVTAAKSIGKKMPSGVHMGNDLLRITIPAGTRVISTYNPFVRDTQKSADKYNGGKLSEEDNRNLRMIKGQNELILPSGSKFISPNGNSISKNEDGSYQLILKAEGKISNNRTERLNFLQEIFNGGKGSGNFNPGRGRGIGKPGKGSNATNVYEKYKDRKNPKPKSLSDSERELRIGTIINNAERMGINLEDIKEDDAYKIMKFIGWEENENGTISTEFGLEKISDKEVKDNDYIVFNGTDSKDGFDSLRDGGYRSRIIDENDGPGIYTSEYYDVALEYSKGEGDRAHKERITPIRIDNSNIISRDDVNKKLRNFNRNFLKNLPDSAVAALAGYDAMWTGNSDKEVVILKPGSAEIIELDEK